MINGRRNGRPKWESFDYLSPIQNFQNEILDFSGECIIKIIHPTPNKRTVVDLS